MIKTTIDKRDFKEIKDALQNPLLKIFWTFAKDDMHHTLMNNDYSVKVIPKKSEELLSTV